MIDYQNLPLPQVFTLLFKIFSKKSPFIFVSYLLMPYFCIRFPRDGKSLDFDMLQRRRICLTE